MISVQEESLVSVETHHPSTRFYFVVSIFTAALAAVALGLAVTTLPKSGPFAAPENLIPYPYSEATKFVPRDFVWMYPAILMMLSYLVLAICLQRRSSVARRIYANVGSTLAAIAFAVIGTDYFIQLRTVQPSLMKGETEGLAIISQFNPHGLFIALEEFGFLVTGISFGCIAFALGSSKFERASKWVLTISAISTVLAFIGMSLYFGMSIEYRFEVAAISLTWLTLITTGVLLALNFRRESQVR